jgi:hypothetical protein
MTTAYGRSRYYTRLADQAKLSSADVVRILNQSQSLGTEDYYAAQLLKEFAPRLGDSAAERKALTSLIGGMKSDYYVVAAASAVFDSRRALGSDADFLATLVSRMQADYYRGQLVHRVAAAEPGAASRKALVDAIAQFRSGYYAARAIDDLVSDRRLSSGELLDLVGAARGIREDYYRAEALTDIVRHGAANDRVRDAVVEATSGMNRVYADRVRRAAGAR